MSREMLNLADDADPSELRVFLQNANAEEIVKIVRNNIYKTDISKRLDHILQAFSDADTCRLKRYILVESTLKTLRKVQLTTGQVDAIVSRIIFDLSNHSTRYLVKLVDFCIARIHSDDDATRNWKDLLPALLQALENKEYIARADTEISATEYKSIVVEEICSHSSNAALLPSLAKMFGDMALDKTNRTLVLKGLCRFLPQLSLDQVPPFVYQALKLCKDRDNQYFLDILCQYFHSLHSKAITAKHSGDSFDSISLINPKEIRDVESTVLYHMYQATQLNHENMKDCIRYLKTVSSAPEYVLQPFMLSVLLSISSIYDDQVYELLKLSIVNSSTDTERRQSSAWLRLLLPSSTNVVDNIRRVIESSNKDCHLTLKGLIDLAFLLMSTDRKMKNNGKTVWRVGGEMIREVTKKRHETVAVVLQKLVDKIVAGGVPTEHYTDCLNYACRELSIVVLDHQIWIMLLLERVVFLPSAVASRVLSAIFPLMHVSANIRENLLLTLRKALYRKGISKRQMAVTAFLQMLKYSKAHSLDAFRLSQRCNSSAYAVDSASRSTLTQVTLESSTQQEKSPSKCDKTLCYEILDILKKSLTHEFQVRLHLYEGLYGAVTRNLEITEIVLDMLLSHFDLYLDIDHLPPIKFELCTEIRGTDITVQEPIAELMFALQKIYIGTFSRRKSTTSDKLRDILQLLCTRMAATELDHLQLDQGMDLHGDFPKSHTKIKHLCIAIAIYEALIAFRIGEWSIRSVEMPRQVQDLFKGYTRFVDFLRTQSVKTKKSDSGKVKKDASNTTKKSVKFNSIKLPDTIMDLDTICQCLSFLYCERSLSIPREALREDARFVRYVLETCEQLLQRITLTNASTKDSPPEQLSKEHVDTCIEIGGLLYEHFISNLSDTLDDDDAVALLAVQCFKEIICICTSSSSPQRNVQRFLKGMLRLKLGDDDADSLLERVSVSLLVHLKRSLATETWTETRQKVAQHVLQIVDQCVCKSSLECSKMEKTMRCIMDVAEMGNVCSSFVPAVVETLLNVEGKTQEYGEVLNEMCSELCAKVGVIEGTEVTMNERFRIIREETAPQVYSALNNQLKERLNNASWLLMRLKAEDIVARTCGTIDVDNSDIGKNKLREKERSLCKHLSYLAQVLYTLANTTIEPGLCTESTFKNLQYLYHLLGNLTKYFYVKSNAQNPAYQSVKYIQVIQLAGKPLKSAFYNLVTHVEETQNKSTKKADSHARRNKILKETKLIPRVVYEIEQFNKEVLLLGKRTGIPLENYMKHSVTRDFRIKNPQLVEDLEKMDVTPLNTPNAEENAENNEHRSSSDTTDDDTSPSRKKRPRKGNESVVE